MANSGTMILPVIDINRAGVMLKADKAPDMLTYDSSLSGTSYIIDKYGGVLIINNHGFYRAQWKDLMVICRELTQWIIPEADRWENS